MYELRLDWIEVNIGHHLRSLIARMTAKTFMGNPTCRDPEWLKIAVDFSLNLASYNFTVKIFPNWMHGLVARFIPARHRMSRQYDIAERVVRELTHQHDLAKRARLKGEEVEEEDTLLNWMLDHGSQSEIEPFQMGVRQCALIFASIHTVAATMSNMLYDLCTNREWLEVLREEVEEISKELGPPIQNTNNNAHAWCTRLDKLDSFIVESQRHHPLSLLIPQRLAHQEIKFKDGMTIPAGSQLAFASYEYSMDPLVNGNPQEFDPMRSYRKRMAGLDQWDLHKASMAHPGNLAFGYGNQGCPGRRFAVSEMKIIMACLLYEFEFKFPEGRTRPKSHHLNQFCFTNQSVTLMMKKL
ncbi:hypothetical protein N7456_007312 [Penicillium angulare]|uniref:Cytochrome P450 n=1 Tax=Penicillium angulare TaxID=116970 RepID=A0A9W9FAE7_9EURO|nr:hypothetical protein N7456_007312 [Penicillium angulare]